MVCGLAECACSTSSNRDLRYESIEIGGFGSSGQTKDVKNCYNFVDFVEICTYHANHARTHLLDEGATGPIESKRSRCSGDGEGGGEAICSHAPCIPYIVVQICITYYVRIIIHTFRSSHQVTTQTNM